MTHLLLRLGALFSAVYQPICTNFSGYFQDTWGLKTMEQIFDNSVFVHFIQEMPPNGAEAAAQIGSAQL